ncbi:hypothetical protein [Actinomadura nitritigenes]|uniref:hypothetical protein n=1 Tax=Actinomadura nitritigenes TaxID=134602 RepID=UPI003D9493A8
MTSTPHRYETDGPATCAPSALDELRAAYREQLNQLAAERDEARRQARRAKAQAAVARADLASLQSRVQELLAAAARHLPDLPAVEPAERPAEIEAAPASRALPVPEPARAEGAGNERPENGPAEIEPAATKSADAVRPVDARPVPVGAAAASGTRRPAGDPDDTSDTRRAAPVRAVVAAEVAAEAAEAERPAGRAGGETVRHQNRRKSRKARRGSGVRTG